MAILLGTAVFASSCAALGPTKVASKILGASTDDAETDFGARKRLGGKAPLEQGPGALSALPPTSGGELSALPPTSGGELSALPPTSGGELSALPPTSGGELSALPPTSGGELTGTLRISGAALEGNYAIGLADTTVANLSQASAVNALRSPFRILAACTELAQNPVSKATVRLTDAEGLALTSEVVTTDEEGKFRLKSVPSLQSNYLVEAHFDHKGEAITLSSLATVPSVGGATVDIDVATSMISAKIRKAIKRGRLTLKDLRHPTISEAEKSLRCLLDPGLIPFLGKRSKGILRSFDQLAIDVPDFRNKLSNVSESLTEGDQSWSVSTALTFDQGVTEGIFAVSKPLFGEAGDFEVDRDGNLYLPTFATGTSRIRIIRRSAQGAIQNYATLPAGIENPVYLGFTPGGILYVVGRDSESTELRIFAGSGEMVRQAGYLFRSGVMSIGRPRAGRIAVDDAGTVYFSTIAIPGIFYKNASWTQGKLLAGSLLEPGTQDGTGDVARFAAPNGLTLESDGSLYVTDKGNDTIRRLTLAGVVTTIAGKPGKSLYRNGRGARSRWGHPAGIAIDASGDVYIADTLLRRIRQLSRDGSVSLVAGTGDDVILDGTGAKAGFHSPKHLALDAAGNVYVLDTIPDATGNPGQHVIRKIGPVP